MKFAGISLAASSFSNLSFQKNNHAFRFNTLNDQTSKKKKLNGYYFPYSNLLI